MNSKIFLYSIFILISFLFLLNYINIKQYKQKKIVENFTDNLDQFEAIPAEASVTVDVLKKENDIKMEPELSTMTTDYNPQTPSSIPSITPVDTVLDNLNKSNDVSSKSNYSLSEPSCYVPKPSPSTCEKPSPPTCEKPKPVPKLSCPKPIIKKIIAPEKCNKVDLSNYRHISQIPDIPDMSKYIEKTLIPTCPNMKDYIKRSEIPICPRLPNMNKYVLKSEVPKYEFPDLNKYVLKSSVPHPFPKCEKIPKCPKCPKCPNIKCPDVPEYPEIPECPKVNCEKFKCPKPTCPKVECPSLYCPKVECPDVNLSCKKEKEKIKHKTDYLSIKNINHSNKCNLINRIK